MSKFKVFISSVQSEFAPERQRVFDFIRQADLMKEHGSFPHNPYLAEALYQVGYIEKYGTGITENIRKMLEAHLLAPTIDLGGEFVTTIWREDKEANVASETANMASEGANVASEPTNVASEKSNVASERANAATNVASDHLEENRRLIDSIIAPRIKPRMTAKQIRECIIDACIVEHSTEELGALLHKAPAHLRNRFIPDLVNEGILLRTKLRHAHNQTYITNPKYK